MIYRDIDGEYLNILEDKRSCFTSHGAEGRHLADTYLGVDEYLVNDFHYKYRIKPNLPSEFLQ